MKKGMRFLAIFSFAVIAELLSVGTVSAADVTVSNSLSSKYYRIPVVTSATSDLAPSDARLISDSQMILATKDVMSLFDTPQTDQQRFPNADTLPGQPAYFVAHWSGSIVASKDGDYRVTLSSHEASQLFINGAEIISVKPNDQLGGVSLTMHLSEGASNVDIFFAKRSDFQSGLNFKIDGVKFNSLYQENMPTANIVSPSAVVSSAVQMNVAPSAENANIAPSVVYFNPPTVAEEGKYFAYKVLGQDPDSASLSYKLIDAPQGMSIAPSTGLLLWKPSLDQVSKLPYSVVIQVSDGTNKTTSRFEISVKIPVTNSALSRNKTNSQVSGNLTSEPARNISAENISVSDKSPKETSAPAGSRLSASVLFTGVFKLGHWLVARMKSIFYFLISMVLTGLTVYVLLEIIDRKKQNKNINRLAFTKSAAPQRSAISQMENA